ncbi:hypothetical protein KKE68_02320, partial [Patescibacteria group bacterium]|nr:hypothetical protein [Patescibacteria group bacterium]
MKIMRNLLLDLVIILAAFSFLASHFSKNALADWSVWETPVVYYDFEGGTGDANIKDRAGNNNLTLTATSG